ncbi:hypothetical protein HX799_07840 [Pseudomonas tolaasii]|uniref:hypothetical protein n=1 Tax=Pseudomonas tolaasii TaxID=29442 RepID=UPI0015A15AFA|nr:hypothetical protein [Pseudomonas tolaasii]NWC30473.1 hypothetical protein [Pseudomonas tolaasii]NWC51071.1 hypothetical protein [Pseudomonas tolaasii]NWE62667.1 hypothetical protein [Pseudomonas tolaasii]
MPGLNPRVLCMALLLPAVLWAQDSAAARLKNDIPPRLQWTANYGYCGEVAFISAGLYYGQYVSQYDARALASPGVDQSHAGSQLLPGVNDVAAAARMHLQAQPWNSVSTPNANHFLTWVKGNVLAGYPVIIGVYENMHAFEGSDDTEAGDAQYDHIVPVIGVASKHPFTSPPSYYADDVLTLSDNGLWSPDGAPVYRYHFPFGEFQASREAANAPSRPVYSLPRDKQFGVAVTGIIDHDGQTLPVRLWTDVNAEEPAMAQHGNKRPPSAPLTLTLTISDLKPDVSYSLYRYDHFAAVPDAAFNANASRAAQHWKIKIKTGSTYTLKETIRSDEVAVYRAVPDSAP